jgi:hypothetical protein
MNNMEQWVQQDYENNIGQSNALLSESNLDINRHKAIKSTIHSLAGTSLAVKQELSNKLSNRIKK